MSETTLVLQNSSAQGDGGFVVVVPDQNKECGCWGSTCIDDPGDSGLSESTFELILSIMDMS